MWKAIIEKIDNGYIIKMDDGERKFRRVVKEPEVKDGMSETKSEQIAFRDVIYELREFFSVFNDKHTNQYMDIKITNIGDEL